MQCFSCLAFRVSGLRSVITAFPLSNSTSKVFLLGVKRAHTELNEWYYSAPGMVQK